MTKEQEKETIKYLEFLQKEYLEDAKRKKRKWRNYWIWDNGRY